MIEVRITPTGDKAEADTPEEAIVAARTMIMDSVVENPTVMHLRAWFYVGGKLVRGDVRVTDLHGFNLDGKSPRNLVTNNEPVTLALGTRVNNIRHIRSVGTNGVSTATRTKEEVSIMSATKTKELHEQLMDGFTVKSRPNGTVHTIKGADEKSTVAEVCVGKKQVRLNFKKHPDTKAPKGLELGGKSNSWKGGGAVINSGNLSAARALLQYVVKNAKPTATATTTTATANDAAGAQSESNTRRTAAQARVTGTGKRSSAKRSTSRSSGGAKRSTANA